MRYMAAVSVAVLAGILFIACAGSQYGGLRPAKRGESALSNDPVGADYRYYQTPNVNRPNAIIAIHKNYTLQTDAWSEISAAGGFSNRHVYSGSMGMAPKILEIRGRTRRARPLAGSGLQSLIGKRAARG